MAETGIGPTYVSASPSPTPVYRVSRGPESIDGFWRLLGLRIALSAGAAIFGISALIGSVNTAMGIVMSVYDARNLPMVVALPISLGVGCYVAFMAILWMGAFVLPTLAFVWLFLRAVGWRPRRDYLAMFCGSLATGLALCPFTAQIDSPLGGSVFMLLPVAMIGASVAWVQWAAAKAALLDLRRRRVRPKRRGGWPAFSIAQMLIVTATLGVLLAAVRLLGEAITPIAMTIIIALSTHLLTRDLTATLLNRRLDRRLRLRRKKRLADARST